MTRFPQPVLTFSSFPLSQVGGHTRLLLLNQSTVIKPLNLRELEFYQNIPSDIQQLVPKYRGKSKQKKIPNQRDNQQTDSIVIPSLSEMNEQTQRECTFVLECMFSSVGAANY